MRELENVIERAIVLSGAEVLMPDAFALDTVQAESGQAVNFAGQMFESQPTDTHENSLNESLQQCLDRTAISKVRATINAAQGNRTEAATALGIDRTTLYRLMKRLGMQ